MSFAEILTAARELSQAEKLQLLQSLMDEVSTSQDMGAEEGLLARLFPEGAVAIQGRAELISPIPAPEAAAALAALLAKDHGS